MMFLIISFIMCIGSVKCLAVSVRNCISVAIVELGDGVFVGLLYIHTLQGYLVMGIPYMVVSLFVHLYVFVTSCAQYKHKAQSLIVHSWSQHLENPTQTH